MYIHKTFEIYSFKTGWGSKNNQAFIMYDVKFSNMNDYVDEWYDCYDDIIKLKNYHKTVLKLIKKKWWVKGQYTYFYTKHSHGGGHRFWLEKNVEIPNYTRYINSCITPDGVILMTNYNDNGVSLYNPLNNKIYLKNRPRIQNTDLINMKF
tara:strand:- start:12 stop:464 length:453 start_codon:yes stop_codon:yes gene_type:complete